MEKVDTAKPSSRTAMKLMLYSCAQHQTGYHGELHERYLSYTGHDSALCGFAAGTSGSSSGMGQSRKQFLASGSMPSSVTILADSAMARHLHVDKGVGIGVGGRAVANCRSTSHRHPAKDLT